MSSQRERRAELNNPAMRVMAEYEHNKRAWERAQMAKRWGWPFATKKSELFKSRSSRVCLGLRNIEMLTMTAFL